jgi:hypothetical protein
MECAIENADTDRPNGLDGVDLALALVGDDNSGLELSIDETVHPGL